MTAPLPEVTLSDEQRDRVKNLVCEVLDIEPEDITLDRSFSDFGADSMALVALGASLERTFDIELKVTMVSEMDDLGSVMETVAEALAVHR